MNRNEEILTILQEECAEVIQAVSKVRRFGLSDNVGELKKELCDLICMIELMREFNVIPMSYEEQLENIFQKREKLKNYFLADLRPKLKFWSQHSHRQVLKFIKK